MGEFQGKVVISGGILIVTTAVTFCYGSGGWGVKVYEFILKIVVAVIVLCFFGVVVKLSLSGR